MSVPGEMTIEEARGLAAQAWGRPKTKDIDMDPVLAEEFARILAKRVRGWQREAHRYATNADYWRGRFEGRKPADG